MPTKSLAFWLMIPCIALLSIAGCPPRVVDPRVALAGVWEFVSDEPQLGETLLTFDRNGDLTQITYVVGGVTFTPTTFAGTTDVDADKNVSVSATFGVSTFAFFGTINEGLDQIIGTTSFNLATGTGALTVNTGNATMNRILP
jgi:hypothetical protein